MVIILKPIGQVHSPFKNKQDIEPEKFASIRGFDQIEGELEINNEFAEGLTDIEDFSHIIVIFEMHQSSWTPNTDLVRRPQGRADMPPIGIFAQRAKHRPNPIGITSVRLLAVEGNILKVRGLDAIDETPVLDIKPYFPRYDRVAVSRTPEWVDRLMADYF